MRTLSLRQKIEKVGPQVIQTVWGVGYKFDDSNVTSDEESGSFIKGLVSARQDSYTSGSGAAKIKRESTKDNHVALTWFFGNNK